MEKNNLFQLLKSLTKEEVKDFKKFIASPYFSTGRDLTKYYSVIIKYYPEFDVTKEKLRKDYFKTLKDEKKQLKILRTLNSDMIKILENYFLIKVLKRNEYYKNLILIEDYWFRKLFSFGEKKYTEFVKNPKDLSADSNRYWQLYALTNPMMNILAFSGKETQLKDIYKTKSELLISFFLGASGGVMTNLGANSNMYNIKEYKNIFTIFLQNINFEDFLSRLDDNTEAEARLKLETYILICQMDAQNFDKYYEILKSTYENLYNAFTGAQKSQYFMRILNLFTHTGKKQHLQTKFEFVKFVIDANLYPEKEFKYIHWQYYKMFFLTGLNSHNPEWSEEFHKNYIDKTDPLVRDILNKFSLSFLAHEKGNYEESLKYLSEVKFFNEAFSFDMRLMQIRNYYELLNKSEKYYDTFTGTLDAFRHFIDTSKKVNRRTIKTGNSFVKAMRLLGKYRISDKETKDNLMPEIISMKPEIRHFWLIDKFDEILIK